MQSNNKKWPVNWINGMNINQSHFINEQRYHTGMLVDAINFFTTPFNYGVNTLGNQDDSVYLGDVNDNLEVDLTLKKASFLFPGGASVQVDPENKEMCDYSVSLENLKDDGSSAYIVLGIDLYNRVPYGEPSPEEMPARNPFTIPKLSVSAVSEADYNGSLLNANHLIIGRLINNDGSWKIDLEYIPPVQNISAYPVLSNVYHILENHLSSIERSSVEIVQKIRAKKQDNVLAQILFELSQSINLHLSQKIPAFKTICAHQSPVELMLIFVELARIFKNTIDSWQDCGKDEMMTYLAEWCNINQGEFEEVVNALITLKYDHNQIKKIIDQVSHFADMLSPMFTILAGLDYVGKKIETSLFVTEEKEESEEVEGTRKKKKFSFLGN